MPVYTVCQLSFHFAYILWYYVNNVNFFFRVDKELNIRQISFKEKMYQQGCKSSCPFGQDRFFGHCIYQHSKIYSDAFMLQATQKEKSWCRFSRVKFLSATLQ